MDALRSVAAWPVGSAAVAVVRFRPDGATERSAVGDPGRPYPWASVTKPAVALAALVAVEEGTLHLDEPVGPPGSTVRHLLAHASGLGPDPGPPVEPPATRRIYSNAGYVALGAGLEARSGMTIAEYVTEGVLGPLGMAHTTFADAPAGAAATGLVGSLDDLVALGLEWAKPALIGPITWADAVSVQFPGLAGVLPGFGPFDPCDWGLGVERRGSKRPHWTGTANSPFTYGHFGQTGSFLWIDPVAGVLCAGLSDRPFGVWASRAWPALADAVLREVATPGVGDPDRGSRSPSGPV